MIRNQYFISFGVTREEKDEIERYCQKKKRWKSPADLARDSVWQLMSRNPIYKKHAQKEAKTEGVSNFIKNGRCACTQYCVVG